jgi:uncharacterized protein (TIGR03086 family)
VTADLGPATTVLGALVRRLRDDQLDARTPCGGISVGALLDHVDGLCGAFADAGTKTRRADGGAASEPDASRLGDDWRERIPARLDALAAAWRPDDAWTGTTVVGGIEMTGGAAGAAALDEVIVHGWDLAVAIGEPYPGGDALLAPGIRTACEWVGGLVAQHPEGIPGLFGPAVPVPPDASPMDRLLGLAGRDPGWTGPRTTASG